MFPPRQQEHAIEFLTSDGLRLVGRAFEPAPSRGRAVVCHPHPLYGGTMDNKVVTTAARAAAEAHLATLRFDFRGVGASEGEHDGGHAEVEDVSAALEVHAGLHPGLVALIGFSFGAAVSVRALARGLRVDTLILLGPPLQMFALPKPPPPPRGILILVGDADVFCSVDEATAYARQYGPEQAKLIVVPEADHFFTGRLSEVAQAIHGWLGGVEQDRLDW